MPTLGLTVEAPILVLVTIAAAEPSNALDLLFPWVMFRVFRRSVSGYVGAVINVAGGYVIGGLIWPALHGARHVRGRSARQPHRIPRGR